METPVIRYNLKDRGRRHTGQARNFNIRAIVDAVNGPATQERVAARDMQGYYGHWPRIKFGMLPSEGGIVDGKVQIPEPAIVTTHLKAYDDGTIEHRAEFLDTAAGQLAAKLWAGKVGGFSSAIDQTKPEFFGFDYVQAPNYLGNSFRNAALDSADQGTGDLITFDAVCLAEQVEREQGDAMAALLDSITAERAATNAVIERLTAENEQFLSALARRGIEPGAVLDAVALRPVVVEIDPMARMQRDTQAFMDSATLPGFVSPEDEQPAVAPLYERLISKFTRR